MARRGAVRDAFAVDFDGVLCDSAAETGTVAWRACARIWSDWRGLGPEPPSDVMARFLRLRPLVEVGGDALLLMRLATWLEEAEAARRFPGLRERAEAETGRSLHDLSLALAEVRQEWIRQDRADWVSRHRFYPGTLEKFASRLGAGRVWVLTTKQDTFARELLQSQGISLPADRIFGLNPRKTKDDVLRELLADPELSGFRFHFVEDRLDTLLRVARQPELAAVALYLAAWGYNTEEQRGRARAEPRITVWELEEFLRLPPVADH